MIKYWNQRRYTAWFDAEYPFLDAEYQHADYDERLRNYVEQLRRDIEQNGMYNPLLVNIRENRTFIHPGKCRARALSELGRETAPAVVVDWTRVVDSDAIPDGCEFLDSKEKVEKLFSGDARVEMSHRGLVIKKARN